MVKPNPDTSAAFDDSWLDAAADRARALVDQAADRGAALVEAWIARKNAGAVAQIANDDGAPAPARDCCIQPPSRSP